jgi:hypothetical protein
MTFLHRHRAGRIDRQIIDLRQQQAEPEVIGDAGMDDEYRVDRQEQADQQAIEKGLVIGDNEQALVRKISLAQLNFDAKQQPGQAAQQRPQKLAHQQFSFR